MKHKISILVCMLLLVQVAYSQMKSYEGFVTTNIPYEHDGSVVKHWTDNKNVVSFCDNIGVHWYIAYHRVYKFVSGAFVFDTVSYASVPPGLEIKDLFVHGNNTYFCGSYLGKGAYGWFPIDTSFTLTSSIQIYPVNQVDTLRKLVVCPDTLGRVHLTAIGVSNANNQHCILEVPNTVSSSYKLAFVNPAGGWHDEVLDDVVLTDDYVVFVSRDKREGVGELTFRYSSPVNVLGNPLIDTHYHILTTNSETSYPVAATRMDGNDFAVGYTAGNAAETRVHYLTAGSGINLIHSQSTSVCGTARMMDMTYHSTTGKVTLLWPDFDGYSHFLAFSPYVTGVQVATHPYHPRARCYSIDDMDGEAFVAFGGNGITLQRTYTALDFHTLIGCMYPGTAVISTYVAPPANSFTEPLQIMTFSTSPSSYSFGFLLKNKFKYCSSN